MIPVAVINQETRFGRFSEVMANLNAHLIENRRMKRNQIWSAQRIIGFALVTSGALWTMIFWVAKALVV